MRPKPFIPEIYNNDERYIIDKRTNLIWHKCTTRTLYADIDRSQIVYHANYLRYFEFGRTSLMRDVAYPYSEIEKNGFVYPIIELGLNFYQPLYYDDLMNIYTRPLELEKVKLKFDYIITHAEKQNIICMGFTRHCALNSVGKPVAVDEKTVHLWKTFPK